MQVGPLYSVAIFAFAVSLSDGAQLNHYSGCQEEKVMECLERKFQGVADANMQQDISGVMKAVCTVNKEPCTDIHAAPDCPGEMKKALAVMETSLAAAIDALCANDGALLKKVPEMVKCWDQAKFVRCVERLSLAANHLDFFTTKRTPQDVQTLRAELPKCIEESRKKSKECEGASLEPLNMFLSTFLNKSLPDYSGNTAAQAGSSLTAFISIIVALIFMRQA